MLDIGKYTPEFLEPFRLQIDEPAYSVIKKILEVENMGVLRELFNTLATNEITSDTSFDIFNESIRKDVQGYFEKTRSIPAWADKTQFDKATALFQMYGPEILTILIAYSLPFCYTCAKGAKVLAQTGRLQKHDGSLDSITRRLVETAQFVINLLTPNALLGELRDGIVSIQKVRLIHATIRYYILDTGHGFNAAQGYDEKVNGMPINQEDLAGTMLSFSVIILKGLEKYDVILKQDQKEALVHYWNVIGSMLGVPNQLIPENHAQAVQLANGIFNHQAAYSPEGTELTMSCVSFMDYHVPGQRFKDVPLSLIYFFGEDYNIPEIQKLPPTDHDISIIGSRFFKRMESNKSKKEHHTLIRSIAGLFSRELIEGFLKIFNEGKKIKFNLPSSLTDYGRPLEFRKKLPVDEELKTIEQAIYFLQEITDYFKATDNPMGLFAAIYLLSTRMVYTGLANNQFKQPEIMHQVDVAFVNRYFTAINHYLNQTEPTEPWCVAFRCAKRSDMFVDQYIFAAANAHIVFDLGIAVATVCPGNKIYAFEDDFNKMNDVFASMYYQMNVDVADIWGPFAKLMKWTGNTIVKFENKVMDESRAGAWKRAVSIATAGNNQNKMINQLSKHAVEIGEKIIYPGWFTSLMLKHFASKEVGSVADKIDVMLRTDLLKPIN